MTIVFPYCTRENLRIRLSPLGAPHLTQSTITPNNFFNKKIIIAGCCNNITYNYKCQQMLHLQIAYDTLPGCALQQNICPYIVCSRSKWEQHLQHLSTLQWQFVWVGLTFLFSQFHFITFGKSSLTQCHYLFTSYFRFNHRPIMFSYLSDWPMKCHIKIFSQLVHNLLATLEINGYEFMMGVGLVSALII